MSDSLQPHGLQPTRLLHPWDFLGKSTGVGCHCLLYNPANVGNLISSSSSFSEPSLDSWKFLIHIPAMLARSPVAVPHHWAYANNTRILERISASHFSMPFSSSAANYWVITGMGREGNGTPLQYSCLENPMDRGAWWAAVPGVAKSRT